GAPATASGTAQIARAARMARSGAPKERDSGAWSRGSSRMRCLLEALTRHHEAQSADRDLFHRLRVRQAAAIEHRDAIGKGQEFVQVLGDQDDTSPPLARCQ